MSAIAPKVKHVTELLCVSALCGPVSGCRLAAQAVSAVTQVDPSFEGLQPCGAHVRCILPIMPRAGTGVQVLGSSSAVCGGAYACDAGCGGSN